MKKSFILDILYILLMVFLVSCAGATPTPLPEASPSLTVEAGSPTSTWTRSTPTFTPSATLVPVEGETTTLVNVRAGPGTGYELLGRLDEGSRVLVVLQNDDGEWFRILYPSAPDGYGWVASLYVRLPEGTTAPRQVLPTITGFTGSVLIKLNVREGPGTSFDTLGMLEEGAQVVLTAKNNTASWFRIEYPAGSGKHGWVTAQYIQTDFASQLPVVDAYGQVVVTGTPGAPPAGATPTPTLGPAPLDGDSASDPAVSITFASSGTRSFTYSSMVSNPAGDAEDWLEFTPFASLPAAEARLRASLACSGNGALRLELWQAGALFPGWGTLACGDTDQLLTMPAGQAYQFRLLAEPGDGLRFVQYSLTVENLP